MHGIYPYDRSSQSMQQALAAPEVQQQRFAQGALARASSSQAFAQLIASDRKRYADIINSDKITLD
jgi:tripartite-type tricarboxylate transporter receptor subunit TctC